MSELRLQHFRNLGIQELAFPPEGAAVIGDNAQGKSNLLEAVYYLETFRSFRGARDDQLVAFDNPFFRLEGCLEDASDLESRRVAAAFETKGRKKKVTVDRLEPDRLSDALGALGAVIFSPADVAIVNDGPVERRRYLDIVLSLNVPGYLRALQEYRHVLAQRNAALREDRGQQVVAAWNDGLVTAGATVMLGRKRWTSVWRDSFTDFYRSVSGGEVAGLAYHPSVALDSSENGREGVADAFRDALVAGARNEGRLRTTVVGPHRDDLRITLGDSTAGERALDIRDFGSGGQRRTAALALRLVEAATIRGRRGRDPIILMDDAFAELDEGRSERILDLLEKEDGCQVILTAPKEGDVRLRRDSLARWSIRDGVIYS